MRTSSLFRALAPAREAHARVVLQGFWSDVEHYYTEPPPLLTVDHLSGDRDDVEQLFKVLLTAAYVLSLLSAP